MVGRNAADAANGFAINDAGNNAFEKGVFFRGGGGGVGVEQADEAGSAAHRRRNKWGIEKCGLIQAMEASRAARRSAWSANRCLNISMV